MKKRESTNIGGFGEGLRVDMFLPGPPSLVNHFAGLENGTFPPLVIHQIKQYISSMRGTKNASGAQERYNLGSQPIFRPSFFLSFFFIRRK